MSNYLTDFHVMLNRQHSKRKLEQEAILKELRASDDASMQDLLSFAEHLYKKECEEIDPIPSPFEARTPGFQMRLIQEAEVFFQHYERVKGFKEQGDCSHE